jgi:PAB-dependent poly(A)-specific ribonuclease subunit 3
MDPEWAETGDRYLLKLFRDYVFHQVDENGAPLIEMAHVVQCLNKVLKKIFPMDVVLILKI